MTTRAASGPTSAAVLVTGASTGIGLATVQRLARAGTPVLAGVRKEADAQRLNAIPGVEALTLDVTDEAHVAALAQRLASTPLCGLVNNAGIAVPGPLEELPLDELRRQFEVNVFATVAVTRAALPALRLGKGRVVNVGSIGGRVGQPLMGAYCGSKGAIHLISASLRRELEPWKIWVACVEPGSTATEIWDKGSDASDELLASLSPEGRGRYGTAVATMGKVVARQTKSAIPADDVAARIEHALTAARPHPYYLVGRDARVLSGLQTVLPARAMDALIRRALGM